MDWRVWALTSASVHLLILLVCFVLVYYDKWPSFHHRRVEKLSLGARIRIKQVVDEHWEELLDCAKNLIDARLEDGVGYFVKLSDSEFRSYSQNSRCFLLLPKN